MVRNRLAIVWSHRQELRMTSLNNFRIHNACPMTVRDFASAAALTFLLFVPQASAQAPVAAENPESR
jgi:hypothetical protein